MDLLIQFPPSLPHISGDSPPKNYKAGYFVKVFLSSSAEKEKRKLFQTGEQKDFTNWVYLEYYAGNFEEVRQHLVNYGLKPKMKVTLGTLAIMERPDRNKPWQIAAEFPLGSE